MKRELSRKEVFRALSASFAVLAISSCIPELREAIVDPVSTAVSAHDTPTPGSPDFTPSSRPAETVSPTTPATATVEATAGVTEKEKYRGVIDFYMQKWNEVYDSVHFGEPTWVGMESGAKGNWMVPVGENEFWGIPLGDGVKFGVEPSGVKSLPGLKTGEEYVSPVGIEKGTEVWRQWAFENGPLVIGVESLSGESLVWVETLTGGTIGVLKGGQVDRYVGQSGHLFSSDGQLITEALPSPTPEPTPEPTETPQALELERLLALAPDVPGTEKLWNESSERVVYMENGVGVGELREWGNGLEAVVLNQSFIERQGLVDKPIVPIDPDSVSDESNLTLNWISGHDDTLLIEADDFSGVRWVNTVWGSDNVYILGFNQFGLCPRIRKDQDTIMALFVGEFVSVSGVGLVNEEYSRANLGFGSIIFDSVSPNDAFKKASGYSTGYAGNGGMRMREDSLLGFENQDCRKILVFMKPGI